MPAYVAPTVMSEPLAGLKLLNRGKVRDTYELDEKHLLVVTSDRISIFDFVLGTTIPGKGMVLNALSIFWLMKLNSKYRIKTHLVAVGSDIDQFLPPELKNNRDLQSRAMVVRRLRMIDIEFIARSHLTGSGLTAYKDSFAICGHNLPTGLADGDRLPWLLDTPTTKAVVGHDEHVDAFGIQRRYPEATLQLLKIFQIAYDYAAERGIILPDTKFEFGVSEEGEIILADEVLTPDSSRFWLLNDWENEQQKKASDRTSPAPYDKQLVRNWGRAQGINKLDPSKQEDCENVASLTVPQDLIDALTKTYRYIFWRLVGQRVEDFLGNLYGVQVSPYRPAVSIVFGSESDISDEVKHQLGNFQYRFSALRAHVASCHRNPAELRQWVEEGCDNADVVIAVGGMALALPGMIKAFANESLTRDVPVIGVGFGEPGSDNYEAAALSIERLPNQPVIIDELLGLPYMGMEGFRTALKRVIEGELPPPRLRVTKPARFNVTISNNGR